MSPRTLFLRAYLGPISFRVLLTKSNIIYVYAYFMHFLIPKLVLLWRVEIKLPSLIAKIDTILYLKHKYNTLIFTVECVYAKICTLDIFIKNHAPKYHIIGCICEYSLVTVVNFTVKL